jgi:ribonucleoside-diphosphate reductase alpha chain
MSSIGPANLFSQQLHQLKYRADGESFDDYCVRYARTLADDESHFRHLLGGLREQRILPAGRQQLAIGRPFQTTAYNCFVGGRIEDSMEGIMEELKLSALTLRAGGGCGWDFSSLRPELDPIRGLGPGARASGPVGFMPLWHTMCGTIMSAGMRRGAMMGVLLVTHPDILKFIRAKRIPGALTNFNISVGATDDFMEAVEHDGLYDLTFGGRSYQRVRALDVWATIMESNWDWAEPGVLFMDRINRMNPLWYCELIAATNPCGEQPLPPHGACLLGSLNVVKYLVPSYARTLNPKGFDGASHTGGRSRYVRGYELNLDLFREDVKAAVRAFDNVIENTVYPLPQQEKEAQSKRRMGLGVTGMANALEVCGFVYGTAEYLQAQEAVLTVLRDTAYEASVQLAIEKGSFPLFDADKWLQSGFAKTLPEEIRWKIRQYGLRNGLLLSIAPTGTISLTADNVSSGIEPPPFLEQEREVNLPEGKVTISLNDYALENYGVRGRTAMECSAADHVRVLCSAQRFIDSSVSKTCNVKGVRGGEEPKPGEITFAEFKDIYWMAWEGEAKGCTTYNMNGKRAGIITEKKPAKKPLPPHLVEQLGQRGAERLLEIEEANRRGEIGLDEANRRAEAAGLEGRFVTPGELGQIMGLVDTGGGDTIVDERLDFRANSENPPACEDGAACFIDPATNIRSCDT